MKITVTPPIPSEALVTFEMPISEARIIRRALYEMSLVSFEVLKQEHLLYRLPLARAKADSLRDQLQLAGVSTLFSDSD